MNGPQLFVSAFLVSAAGLSGCRSTRAILSDYEANVLVGKFAEAASEPAAKADEGGKDALCWQLHAAAAERLAGNSAEAVRRFDIAEDQFVDFDNRSLPGQVADKTASMMTGDYAMPYPGAGQDRIFACLYKAIDFGVMGNSAAVRTELNRALLHQQNWRAERSAEIVAAEERTRSDAQAYARSKGMTAPLGADADGTVSRAFGDAAFSAAVRANAGFDAAHDGLVDRLAEDDYANAYLGRVNETFRRYAGDSGPAPCDRVAVFVEDGMCPKRAEWRIDLPLVLFPWVGRYVQYAGMALPKLVYRNAAVSAYSVSGGGTTCPMAEIQDVDRLVKTEFDVFFRGALTREIIRAVARVGAQAALGAVRDNVSDSNTRLALTLVQLGTAAYGFCTTEADVRSWTALPKKAYMLDLPRPADGVVTVNCGTERVRLAVPEGNTLAFVRKTSSAAPSVVKMFTLPNGPKDIPRLHFGRRL